MTIELLGENLIKSYGKTMAVDDVSLRVNSGEIVGFLGPNGAGKTTTIKMLVGLLRPDKGNITICGHDHASEPTMAKTNIGYVPDVLHLYDKLTPIEFFKFTAEVFRMPIDMFLPHFYRPFDGIICGHGGENCEPRMDAMSIIIQV